AKPSSSPEYAPFAQLARIPAGGAGRIPVGRIPLYLTGCGDRPGRSLALVAEPGPDLVGERVREPVEDGDGLAPGRGGGLAVALGQQRVAETGQRVALAE